MSKSFAFCERCGAKLAEDKIFWLELDQRTGTYTLDVPEKFSQGGFAFGQDCAKIMLTEHATAIRLNSPLSADLTSEIVAPADSDTCQ